MSIRKLGDTITLDFTTHDPATGAVQDADAPPTCEVFEDANDVAILSPAVTKRVGKTGNYRVSIAATVPNGFDVGNSYNAIASATVGGVSAKSRIGAFTLDGKRVNDLNDLAQADILSDATPFPGANIDAAISTRSTLTQAQILNDATPFAGADIANLDVAVSTRSTLTQAQVLSDATPFPGANIDAAVSTRATPAQVNTYVDTALADARLDEFISATAGGIAPVVGSIADQMMNKDGAQTFDKSTDSLEAVRDQMDLRLDVAVSTRSTLTQAQILSDATPFPGANVDAAVSSRATQADILSDATPFPGANIDASITSRPTLLQIEASAILAKQVDLLRTLDLTYENHFLDNAIYAGSNMTSCRLRIYSNAADVGTALSVIATYDITITYVGGNVDTYKVVKV